MAEILVFSVFLVILFESLNGEVYLDRPKIKTSNGDLILEPAYDKNIFLRPNGPKSSIFVGEVDILNAKSKSDVGHILDVPNNDIQNLLSGPGGVLQRLEKIESKTLPLPDELFLNISTLWRKVNNLQRKINNLQTQNNNLRKDECKSNPCQHGGTCLNLINGYHCLCPTNWEGEDCDIDVNECRNFAGTDLGCQNGACVNKPGSYECLCQSGWYGLHCTRRAKDCSGGNFEMCGHGTCLKVDSGEGITCICDQGWKTNGTGVACMTDVNECDSHFGGGCSVNPKVECINLPGSFRCGLCPPGYQGDGYICADVDECTALPNGGCSPMVACHNTIGSRLCGPCPHGYLGDGITCSWRGSCSISHGGCHPSAQCVENLALGPTAQCICPEGMEGDGIGLRGCYIASDNDTKNCENNPCGSHGQCHMLRSGYTCICHRGYGGSHCDISTNLCAGNPCRNNGICRVDDGSSTGFRCECTAQYSGPLCQVLSKTCGGVLDAAEGSIVHPLSNTTYSHNSRCAWVIHTVPSKVINVTFSKFSLENGDDCSNDFLQIHDGRSSASQLLGRFCGNTFPMGGNIISSHNNIYFWFRSDPTVSKEGFTLHWNSIDPVCGGQIDATTHGHISSPGSPGKYPHNRDCYWHLKTDLGKKIQLHFFALDIENHLNCSFDFLAIYDGMRQSDPLLNKYCSSTQPAPILTASSEMLIHFHSDAYGSGNGFQIAYAPATGVPGCGGYFTSERGEITAPSFNGTYLNNMICEYKIKTGTGTKIRIDLKQFHLENSRNCRFDNLKIYDGPSEESPLVGKFCGTTYPSYYIASSNMLFIIFKSDLTHSSEGFKISYKALCKQSFSGDSGVIKSPGYPFSYPENAVCEYLISTTPGKAIQLMFQDFDIEDNMYHNCQNDNVEIRDGVDLNATLLGRFCGGSDHIPPAQLSTHNYMYIRFISDFSVSDTGFYANYTTIDTECGGIYRETTGLINHPSDDSSMYKNDQSCTWILIAPEGMHIKLTWNRFDIEKMNECDTDYLKLIEIDVNNGNYIIGKFCGTKTPPAITTSSNQLKIQFKSDSNIRSSGFSLTYTFLDEKSHCGGNYFSSHGYIYSPGWPRRYESNRDCIWVITVPVGQQIRLNISHIDLERPIRGKCNYGDYLEIRNGASQNTPLIAQYCGNLPTKVITTLANTVHIHFHSDYYLTGNGFRLEWDGSVFGCGGTLTSSTGSISSPNYPNSYNGNSECFYRIVTNVGSRIRISFTDLELERSSRCRNDYVEIFDGRDTEATSLGKHCYMPATLNNIATSSNYAFIKFRSDFFFSGKGFYLNYFTECNNNVTGRYGVIESPDYPNNYPMLLDCAWNINVPKGNRINVTFSHFDVFTYSRFTGRIYPRNHKRCDDAYLQWKESTEAKYSDKLCGMTLPPMITTKSNSLQIKFATGGFMSKTGFRLEWVSYGCGGHIQKRFGTVSIDRSTTTSAILECEWLIETPIGTSVYLVISDLYLTESPNCTTDAVKIYNGQNINYPLLTTVCNRHISSIQATANFMLVQFVKQSSLRGAYFTSSFTAPRSTCGGNIQSLSGFIYSKNYPKNYDDNLDCTWIISVPMNRRIELNILDLDLYTNQDDYEDSHCVDSIKIFDNQNLRDANYTSIICPKSTLKQLTTNNSKVMVQFTSDGYGNAKGFKANFSVTCGASITAINDGIISNERYTDKSCTWTIRAAQLEQKISLTITHISLQKNSQISSNRSCWSSYLRVYDGDNIDAPLIDEFCGKHAPPMIVSHGSAITVLLGSYDNSTAGRFSAHYSTLNEACGGTLTSEEGTIASPNYPLSYPIGANCEWTLSTSPGNKVYIIFEHFELEYSERCNEDYLEIRQNNGAGQLLGVYCGTEIPTNTTTASKLYIKFHSNDKNRGKGFLIHYGFLHGNELINMERGEIASPLYPHLYQGAAIYSWRIESKGTEAVTITIDDLEIPSNGDICNNYLSIYDGYDDTATLLSKLCGKLSQPNKVLQTSSNMAYIQLGLDDSNSGSQFHITWKKKNKNKVNIDDTEKVTCGFNYTELVKPDNVSIFTSPNFPENYDNDLDCEWTFEATQGRHLQLNFIEFALEESNRCTADYINIYSSDTAGQWKAIKESICETKTALQVTKSTKYLKIQFRTDPLITKRGFRGQVSSKCGGSFTDLSGEVGPVWDDVHSGASFIYNVACAWTIKVRPGRVIDFHFTHFNITNRDDDCITSVTLRNGNTVEAPFLSSGKYCGYVHETRTQLTTSSNFLYISYVTALIRSEKVFQNFRIHYEEKGIECGATSKLDVYDQNWEVIQSPNYPLVPVPFSECVWIFTGPPGEILRIDFIDIFDLDDISGCGTEFVEVRDGLSNLSPIIGRYCGDRPSTIKTTNNELYLRYLTQLSEPRVGFKANVSIDICGGTIVSEKGEIKSPGYPHMSFMSYGSVCTWHIKGRPSLVFNITPLDIALPESETSCATKVTIEENVPGNNSVAVLREFCDKSVDKQAIQTSTNEFIIKFYIGKPSEYAERTQSRGFRFNYDSLRPTCGGNVRIPEGYLTTPGYPSETVLRYCFWHITVPDKTRRVRLELIDADVDKNKIGIYNDHLIQSLIQTIPGTGYSPTTRVYESSGNKMTLLLMLSSVATSHRFKAKFSSNEGAMCGGDLNGIYGEFSSPDIKRSYMCEWNYNSRTAASADFQYNSILITATVNSSVARNRCRYSDPRLSIKSTVSGKGLLVNRKFCGFTETKMSIPSSIIKLQATKGNSESFYFHLEWKAQPCGGIINVGETPVNILNIPTNINDTLDCSWLIDMPFNRRLELKMEGFFKLSCDDEYVSIGRGLSEFAITIGDYCKGKTLDIPLVMNFMNINVQYHTKTTNSSSIKLMARTVTGQCGGELSSRQQVFSSPNYPKSYEPNQECSWLITADLGNRVSLRFVERFVVEDRPNCTHDVVIIYDWKNYDYNEMARICGRQPIPLSYNSTYNKMKIVLRTDATNNMDGFKAVWSPICGGKYLATDKKQILYSPGFPFGYSSMADCIYTISAPDDKKLIIDFIDFELEGNFPDCKYDNVTVSGHDKSNYIYLYETFCGSELPTVPSNYNKIKISFKSDRYIQRKGFKISYQIFECGGQVHEPSLLTSHDGRFYDTNMNCSWFIQAPSDKLVVFKFWYIDLESHYDCYNDYVAIYDGLLIDNDKRLGLLCGHVNSTTVLRSHGNTVLLQFVTDQSYNFKGFKVEVSFTYNESVGCGGRIDLTAPSTKTFKTPVIGNKVDYENHLDCHWSITSPPDTIIKIEFIAFHIAPCLNVNQTAIGFSKCDCDLVEIRDGLNPHSFVMGTYCGYTLPPSLVSSENLMSVRFSTDGELTSSGFEARITLQQSLCGQSRFTLGNGVTRIKSPGFEGGKVPQGIHCVYYLDVAQRTDDVVRLSILKLDLQPPNDQSGTKVCNKDKLIVSNNYVSRNISAGKDYILSHETDLFIYQNYNSYEAEYSLPGRMEYCGYIASSDIFVTGGMSLTLITSPESDINHRGFEIEVGFVGFCGRNYTGTQGKIQITYRRVEDDGSSHDCYTLITAPKNHTISAYFISVSTDYWNDDIYLDIYDGNSTSSEKLISIRKDYETTIPLFSNGMYMLLHNHADDNVHISFDMNYVTTDKGRGCGGKLQNELGRVTSPMYPNIYRQKSTCEWEIETPVGTRLKLHFETFDLGSNCDQNYLQIVDGKGVVLSSYCSETPADYISTDNFVKVVFITTRNNGGTGWVADFVGII